MQIEIHIPRPGVTVLFAAAIAGWALYLGSPDAQQATVVQTPSAVASPMQQSAGPVVGAEQAIAAVASSSAFATAIPVVEPVEDTHMSQAEMRMKWARAEQDFIAQRELIVREQLEGLQRERERLGENIDPAIEEQFRRSVRLLTSLVQDRQKAEQFLLTSYRQMWEAEERAMAVVDHVRAPAQVQLLWPVEPELGISAHFLDEAYKKRFKVDHYAIDVPVEQGTTVVAAADGVVKDVLDHGLGYNYVTIDHGGYATVYGHISQFAVQAGQRVRAGEPIGLSGGMPGLPGGGSSTGPHLHFGLYLNGSPVNPLTYLPKK